MSRNLNNKIALVTGASKGIGKEIAKRLAADGAEVILTYASDKAGAEEAVASINQAGGKARAIHADLSSVAGIKKMFADMGQGNIDILINNAGVYPAGGLEDTTEEVFDKIMNLNVKGVFFTTQEAIKRMNQGGRIVNLSSVAARVSFPALGVYCASKAAVSKMTRDFAMSLGERGITVNAVAPGLIRTEGASGLTENKSFIDAIANNSAFRNRIGEADDIAGVVSFLCSEDAKWITGEDIESSGGYML